MPLDEQTQAFLDKANANPSPGPVDIGLDAFRVAVEPFRALGFEREEVAHCDELKIPCDRGEVTVRLYRPDVEEPMPLLVWTHGGSWVRVTVDLLDTQYRALANRSRCAVAAVDYRLSPESQFPAAIDEAYAAARWLKAEADTFGFDRSRIAIGGESSGGNIAAAVALRDRDRGEVGFALQILVLPVLDGTFSMPSWKKLGQDYLLTEAQLEWAIEQYAPGVDRTDPELSPLLAESFAGLPPAIVATGEFDPLKDEGAAYARSLKEAGVRVEHIEIPGLIHHAMMAPKAMDKGKEVVFAYADAARKTFSDSK